MWWWHDSLSAWEWVWMTAMMVAFWGVIVWLVIYVVRSGGVHESTSQRDRSPEQLVDERFARGEIDEDEYVRRREALRRHSPSRDA
jgi:putative membrane protein